MLSGQLFDIQRFGVHDGPGIRTLVFLKGCPLRCAWCCNPESHLKQAQIRYVKFRCRGCHSCTSACPLGAIKPLDGSVRIDFGICLDCPDHPCLEACPHEALSLCGFTMSSRELVGEIAKDLDFYLNSGGGVTFTGGEPLAQAEFLREVLEMCKLQGIHTAIETCGYGSRESFQAILPFTDLFLFDLKLADPIKHRQYTGKSNRMILQNLEYLSDQQQEIIIRLPVVPGITDTRENIVGIIHLMEDLGIREINLEPYHPLGVPKYEQFGISRQPLVVEQDPDYPLESLIIQFLEEGIDCTLA
ncbi:MAG: glycyl-radical enzyme activating protein [Bacteroidales bacterium]